MGMHKNPNYIHHRQSGIVDTMRQLVFGMEDGMVSTLGAVTGIAATTQDPFLIILTGTIVVSVESISMAVGEYLSAKSERSIDQRKLEEETQELKSFPEEERDELVEMYVRDGWPKNLAEEMATVASKNSTLFLQEMAYRELKVFPDEMENPLKNAIVMGLSYIIGGAIPLIPYLLFDVKTAMIGSIGATLIGLFALGVFVTKYSKRSWLRSGMEMVTLAGVAALVGYAVGQVIERFML